MTLGVVIHIPFDRQAMSNKKKFREAKTTISIQAAEASNPAGHIDAPRVIGEPSVPATLEAPLPAAASTVTPKTVALSLALATPIIFFVIAFCSLVLQVYAFGTPDPAAYWLKAAEVYWLKCVLGWLSFLDPVWIIPGGVRLLVVGGIAAYIWHTAHNEHLTMSQKALWIATFLGSALLCVPFAYVVYFSKWITQSNFCSTIPRGHVHRQSNS